MNNLIEKAVNEMINTGYTDPSKATKAEALGRLVSGFLEWTGRDIVICMLSALEDANFHTIHELLRKTWNEWANDGEEDNNID